jgi:esterase/lipase superfamily enzyme
MVQVFGLRFHWLGHQDPRAKLMNERYIKWYTPFDISSFFDGYHDDNIYFNSPFEDLPNTTDPWKYNHMGIIIGTGEWDNTATNPIVCPKF